MKRFLCLSLIVLAAIITGTFIVGGVEDGIEALSVAVGTFFYMLPTP